MTLTKKHVFVLLISAYLLIWLLYQATWLLSDTTQGKVLYFGKGLGDYKPIENVAVQYSVDKTDYIDLYLRNELRDSSEVVSIRYLVFAPTVSRPNTLMGNWGLFIATSVFFFTAITIIYLKKDIVPDNSIFVTTKRIPFLKIVRNSPIQ